LTIIDEMEVEVIAVGFALDLESTDIGIDFVFSTKMLEQEMKTRA